MSRFRFYILPRICLGLSVLLLLFGLWTLWLSLERPMPGRELACRQAETADLLPRGVTVAQAGVPGPYAGIDAWAVRRAGDQLSLVPLTRSLGPLWRSENVFSLDPAEGMVLLTPDVTPVDDDPFTHRYCVTPVALYVPDAAVRVEVEAVWLGDWEDADRARAERGVTAALEPMGGGVWAASAILVSAPEQYPNLGGASLAVRCRAYDGAGALLAQCS